ncbi:Coiled-coil domain-containing protein 63-like Protein [Tribolium castaneum]|uniref:Coiled-coil domain-containing protein 63-like Protein n=2 Tax=Tribolium castaneum TaxID=7070 RepID=D2A6D6_TRICA|nr:Coiled-coil domain-containing protein 63-like Protein [Tribolium castaneum]
MRKLSDEDKYQQQQKQLERELVSLRREFATLERDSSQFNSLKKLKKYTKVFNIFKNEYENIVTNLEVAAAPGYERRDKIMYEELSQRLHDYNCYHDGEILKKTQMKELEGQIRNVSKAVQCLRNQQITDRQFEERVHNARQTLETLENKLETQMTTFNLIVAKNGKLREEIDHLLWDRRNFLTIWNRFIRKLNTGKRILIDLIEQATIAYDQREEWCNKLQLLRSSAHRDLLANIDQMRSLKQKVDNAKKLEEFFTTKGQKRVMKDLMKKEREKREERKKKLGTKLQHYESLMNEILDFSQHAEIKDIARKYYNREAQNFSAFKFIADTINNMEMINDQLGILHLEIDELKAVHDLRAETQHETIDNLETDLVQASEETKNAQQDLEDLNLHLKSVMQGVTELFRMCKCDKDPLLKLLGDNATIHEYNVLLFLQLLEKTIQIYLITAGYKDKVQAEKRSSGKAKILATVDTTTFIYPIERIVRADPCSLCIEHEMVSDVIDVVQRPWTRKEAKEMLQQRLDLPGASTKLHTVSKCFLPQARHIKQKKYC